MTDAKSFLSILAKLMRSDAPAVSVAAYDHLYALINENLFAELNRSHYPNAPKMINRYNQMLDSIESAFLCFEFFGKAVLCVHGGQTGFLLSMISELTQTDIQNICQIQTSIPYVISHSEQCYIEAVNYDNRMISLTLEEVKALTDGGCECGFDLSKLIRFFKWHIPLQRQDTCYIINDNAANKLYYLQRFVTEIVTCNGDMLMQEGSTGEHKKEQIHAAEYFEQQHRAVLYGYQDQFNSINSQILLYFNKEICRSQKLCKAITDDIVRIGSLKNDDLKELRRTETVRQQQLKEELDAIKAVMLQAKQKLSELCSMMQDTYTASKKVNYQTFDCIFQEMFDYAEYEDLNGAQKCQERLMELHYKEISVVRAYVFFLKDQHPVTLPASGYVSWKIAKMVIAMGDLNAMSVGTLKACTEALQNLNTGKEFYAKAMVSPMKLRIECLKKSLELGYAPAGKMLMELFNQGNCTEISLYELANSLVSEACMKIAEYQMHNRFPNQKLNLHSREMVYYKLAASQDHLPAIGKIIDILYQNTSFSSAEQVDNLDSENPVVITGKNLCMLCRYLMERRHNPRRYQEILGVTMFCLNQNLSEAMRQLSGINTPIANYCKGYMYEFGEGTTKDLNQAIIHYEKATGTFAKAATRLEIVKQQKFEKDIEDAKNSYTASSSYSSSSSSSYSSGCFITTAACTALHAGDDCAELNMLRQFRDTYVADSEDGQTLIMEYYRIAPLLVDRINALPDAESVYCDLWKQYIKPSCREIMQGNMGSARAIYIDMVKVLSHQFHVDVDKYISEKYGID